MDSLNIAMKTWMRNPAFFAQPAAKQTFDSKDHFAFRLCSMLGECTRASYDIKGRLDGYTKVFSIRLFCLSTLK